MAGSPFTHYVNSDIHTGEDATGSETANLADLTAFEDVLRSKDPKKLKTFIRRNDWTPQHNIRKELWWKLCTQKALLGVSVYDDLVKEIVYDDFETNLPKFVVGSSQFAHYLSSDGKIAANKVLYTLGKFHPEVSYAPTLYTITSILLHYMEECQVFAIIDMFLNNKTQYVIQTKVSGEAFPYILKELIKRFNKKLYSYIIRQGMDPKDILSDGIWWIFRDLPFYHLVRVIDCYLQEGPKVLYRVILAILQLFYEKKIKSTDAELGSSLNESISEFCRKMPNVSATYLLRMAFKIRGFSRKDLNKLTVKQEMYVQSLINTRGFQGTAFAEGSSANMALSKSFSLQEVNVDEVKQILTKYSSQGTIHLPFTKTGSHITDLSHWNIIWGWLPERVQVMIPELLFSSSDHGTSLRTFYSRVCDRTVCPATLLLVRTTTNKLFGAYCSSDWNERNQNQKQLSYFGTGETFLFTLEPKKQKFQWIGIDLCDDTPRSAQYFMAGDYKQIIIGGGGGGMGLRLDEDLNNGESSLCDTFNNHSLAGDIYFKCAEVEVFGFS